MELENLNESAGRIYTFPKGIPGFEHHQNFCLKPHNEMFNLFQSLSQSDVAFITINPFDLYPNYEFELSQEAMKDMDINYREDVFVQCIVTWHSNLDKITVNLLAPIILNTSNHTGKQIILQNTNYTTKHAAWVEKKLNMKGGDL